MPMAAPSDVARIEAPVTLKAYLLCAFAAFGQSSYHFCNELVSTFPACHG